MDSLNTDNVKAEDMDDFLSNIITVYKEKFPDWHKEFEEDYEGLGGDGSSEGGKQMPDEVKNLVQFLQTHEKLSLKQKNEIIWYHNALMKDKGKYGGKMWKYLENLNKQEILTSQEVQNLCTLSRSWPKAFMVDYFAEPLKEWSETDWDEGNDLMQILQEQVIAEEIKIEMMKYELEEEE